MPSGFRNFIKCPKFSKFLGCSLSYSFSLFYYLFINLHQVIFFSFFLSVSSFSPVSSYSLCHSCCSFLVVCLVSNFLFFLFLFACVSLSQWNNGPEIINLCFFLLSFASSPWYVYYVCQFEWTQQSPHAHPKPNRHKPQTIWTSNHHNFCRTIGSLASSSYTFESHVFILYGYIRVGLKSPTLYTIRYIYIYILWCPFRASVCLQHTLLARMQLGQPKWVPLYLL